GEKGTCCFYFQCIKPDAIASRDFAMNRTQSQNVSAVIEDILGHGNRELDSTGSPRGALLPGEIEARWSKLTDQHGGLLYTSAEVEALSQIAQAAGLPT